MYRFFIKYIPSSYRQLEEKVWRMRKEWNNQDLPKSQREVFLGNFFFEMLHKKWIRNSKKMYIFNVPNFYHLLGQIENFDHGKNSVTHNNLKHIRDPKDIRLYETQVQIREFRIPDYSCVSG